jgi:hypothetical protein
VPPQDAPVSADDARALVAEALDALYANDADLPRHVHERTIAGHFCRYLGDAVNQCAALLEAGWRVDPEYNLAGGDPKALPSLRGMLADLERDLGGPTCSPSNRATDRVVPDVIVHGRGRKLDNLLVCELKRNDASDRQIATDLVKLACFRRDLEYRHACLVLYGDTRDTCVVHLASASLDDIVRYVRRLPEARTVRRWRRGHAIAAERQRELVAERGPHAAQAVAESLSALNTLAAMGRWPAPRDPVTEAAIEQVRRRWARVQQRAKQARIR